MNSSERDSDILDPCIVDLGKHSKKKISKLKRGEGKLALEVGEVISEVLSTVGEGEGATRTLPIIVVVEKKPKKKGIFGFPA